MIEIWWEIQDFLELLPWYLWPSLAVMVTWMMPYAVHLLRRRWDKRKTRNLTKAAIRSFEWSNWWRDWWSVLKPSMKDNRHFGRIAIPRKYFFWPVIVFAPILFGTASAFVAWPLWFVGPVLSWVFLIGSYQSFKPLQARRTETIKKMEDIALQHIGKPRENEKHAHVEVLEWVNADEPSKVRIAMSLSFSNQKEDTFLRQFNQFLGTSVTWVADTIQADEKNGIKFRPGFNYEEVAAFLRAVPPLPQQAPWFYEYIMHPGVPWSFFAIGLSSERGFEFPDPNDPSKTVNLVGYDVAGLSVAQAKKHGLIASSELGIAVPHLLVAGKTGSGKDSPIYTRIRVVFPKDVPMLLAA